MLRSKSLNYPFSILAVGGLLFVLWVAGCGVSKSSSTSNPTTPPAGPQTYFAPSVAGTTGVSISTYSFDDKAAKFWQTTYSPQTNQPGSQVLNAGKFNVSQRGLRSLSISTAYIYGASNTYVPTRFHQKTSASFAVELAGQAGGFAQLQASGQTDNGQQLSVNQPVAPLVAATNCPSSSSQTYQFITIPGALIPDATGPARYAWDPTTETAYGSVDISSKGSTVNFQNIQQFKLDGTGTLQPPPSSLSGICGPTFFGNTTVVPGQAVITNPGVPGTGNNVVSAQATIGIGPSGLLVEDNGSGSGGTLAGSSPPLPYENVLGAGTGAVGLPKPSTALDTGALVGAQYLGFIYAAGMYGGTGSNGWSSHLASFGSSIVQSDCPSFPTKPTAPIYGGDFTNDDPSAPQKCDFAIDLGSPDANGFYSNATVLVGADYPGNSTGATDQFQQAVAIAGKLGDKHAIFLIGVDSTQPWAIYLLQSN